MPSTSTVGTGFGYAAGGNSPNISTVDRIDYSSDTSTATVVGSLTVATRSNAATGNLHFGYSAGGTPGITVVNRIIIQMTQQQHHQKVI